MAFQAHPAQRKFYDDAARLVLACAGAQSGKTKSAAPKFTERVRKTYNRLLAERASDPVIANFWLVVPSYKLAPTPYRYLRERWPTGWSQKHGEVFLHCEPYPRCHVSIRSAEIPESLVSEAVDGVWVNEAARCKPEAWRGGLAMRLTATGGWAIADTTPMGQNWVYQDWYLPSLPPGHPEHDPERYDPEFSSHTWHTADLASVLPEVAERVEKMRRVLPPAFFAREFLADWSAFHGQIFPHFAKALHVRPTRHEDYPDVVIGVDWGYAPGHLGVLLAVGIDRKDRRVGVLEEVVEEGRTDDWWLEKFCWLQQKYGVRRVLCDPSAPDKLAYFRKRFHERGTGASVVFREADNAVREGIMCVAELIGVGSLVVSPACTVTIRQLTSYHWQDGTESLGGDWKEKPAKVDDDCCDALRYACFTELKRMPRRPF